MSKEGAVSGASSAAASIKLRREPRFIVDSMLGSLARWLRMLGYDTIYAKGWHDSRIIEEAVATGRVIITRDKGLYRRALRRGIEAVLVSDNVAEALAKLGAVYGIELVIDPDRSRCPLCNTPLQRVEKLSIRGRVPPRVYESYDEFWICPRCGQVYWRGGHWRGIEETLEEARRLLSRFQRRRR